MSPQLYLILAALLLAAIYFYKRQAHSKNVVYRCFKRYPAEVFVSLHDRATAAAGAWVDDLEPEAYLSVEHTMFFVKGKKVCVRLKSKYKATVDVLFVKQRDGWKRANIMYEGRVIR